MNNSVVASSEWTVKVTHGFATCDRIRGLFFGLCVEFRVAMCALTTGLGIMQQLKKKKLMSEIYIMALKRQYRHDQSRLSTGHGIGVPSLRCTAATLI